jgi:hypothetical protein
MILGLERRYVDASEPESLKSVNVRLAGHTRHLQPFNSGEEKEKRIDQFGLHSQIPWT